MQALTWWLHFIGSSTLRIKLSIEGKEKEDRQQLKKPSTKESIKLDDTPNRL